MTARLETDGTPSSSRNGKSKDMNPDVEYMVEFQPKVKIQIAVSDSELDAAVEAVCNAAATGKIGDGKIFVAPLEEGIRIRTGETGEDAL